MFQLAVAVVDADPPRMCTPAKSGEVWFIEQLLQADIIPEPYTALPEHALCTVPSLLIGSHVVFNFNAFARNCETTRWPPNLLLFLFPYSHASRMFRGSVSGLGR